MSDGQRWLSIGEASARAGVSTRTLQRRVDAWVAGDRSPRAVRGSRTSGDVGDRRVDPVDVERVRLQQAGQLAGTVTADEYAAALAAERSAS